MNTNVRQLQDPKKPNEAPSQFPPEVPLQEPPIEEPPQRTPDVNDPPYDDGNEKRSM